MQATIDTNKHSGTLSGLVLLLAASEHITFEGATIPDNTTAAIVSPAGVTLASGLITSNAVSLNTQTSEAYDYITAQPVASSAPAFLAVGDNTTTLAVFPIRVLRNHLYDMAPPSVSADIYPHRDELLAILARMESADASIEESLTEIRTLDASMRQTLTNFNTAVETANIELDTKVETINTNLDTKVANINSSLEQNAAELIKEMDEFASEALQDLTRQKEDALLDMNAVKEQVEELAASAETSATASAASAEQAEAALALVPEIAIDADSVLEASRLLVGTDPSQLLTLSESI